MKKLFILFAFACFSFNAQAQLPFSLENDTMMVCDVPISQFDTYMENHVINNTGSPLSLRWTRITNDFPSGLSSSICIRDLCYPEATSTNTFVMDPNETAILSAHVFDNQSDPTGMVQIQICLADDPTACMVATFIFKSDQVIDTDEATAAAARFFPNPSTEYFQLENANWVESVSIMDIQGKLIKQFNSNAAQYNVADLQVGSYFAILSDDTGKAVRTIRFEKQ